MYQAAIDKIAARGLIRDRYDNFIDGKWVAPVEGRYFDNPSPITGKAFAPYPAPPRRTSSSLSTGRIRPRTPGARLRSPSAR
jgi:hypothetical protein